MTRREVAEHVDRHAVPWDKSDYRRRATIVQGIASAVMNGESTILLRMEVLLKFTDKEVVIWMTLTIGDLVNREVAEHGDRHAVLWDKSD